MITSETLTAPASTGSRWRATVTHILMLALALVLSLLPAIILHREHQDLSQLRQERARRLFREQAANAARRVQMMVEPGFRLEDLSHRLKRTVERRLSPVSRVDTGLFGAELGKSIRRIRTFAPKVRAWAGFLPGNDPTAIPELIQGEQFETEFKTFFVGLFREILRSAHGLGSNLGDQAWLPRLQNTFGNGVGEELFAPSAEGESFAVVFRHRFRIQQWNLIWQLIRVEGRPAGIVMLLEPATTGVTELDRKYFFRTWATQHAYRRLWPAFLTTPGAQRSVQIIAAPELLGTPALPLLEQLATRCTWVPASQMYEMGTVSMPSTELLTGLGRDNWMALPFSVDPLTGCIGVLCGQVPTPPSDLIKIVLTLYVNLLIFFWTTYALWRLAGMNLPPIGVRLELILWILGIASTPGVLVWGASIRLQADLTFNLEHTARTELIEHLHKMENGVSRIHLQSLKVCRSIVQEPGLHQFLSRLESLPQDQRANKLNDYFLRVDRQLQQSNLDVLAILLYGPGNGAGYVSPYAQYSPATISMMDEFHLAFSLELLRRRFPGFVSEEKRLGVPRKSSINAFISHGMGGSNRELFEALDTVTPFRSSGRQLLLLPQSDHAGRRILAQRNCALHDDYSLGSKPRILSISSTSDHGGQPSAVGAKRQGPHPRHCSAKNC